MLKVIELAGLEARSSDLEHMQGPLRYTSVTDRDHSCSKYAHQPMWSMDHPLPAHTQISKENNSKHLETYNLFDIAAHAFVYSKSYQSMKD